MTEEWLQQTVDVDIQSVLDFADRMTKSIEEFGTSLTDGVMPLMSGVRPTFGGLTLLEGGYFGATHANQIEAAQRMLNDVTKGLNALGMGALGVAVEYMMGDAFSEATVDDVYDAFSPTATSTSPTATTAGGTTVVEEDPLLPPEAYQDDDSPPPPPAGSGHYVGEGEPGQFWIGSDDENMADVPDAPEPRA